MSPLVTKLPWSSDQGYFNQESLVSVCLPKWGVYGVFTNPFDRINNLAVTKFRSLHIEPLPLEKILLLTPLLLGDDYQPPINTLVFLLIECVREKIAKAKVAVSVGYRSIKSFINLYFSTYIN